MTVAPADKGGHRAFDDPIPLLNGRKLVTLRDAALHITKLPKAEHDRIGVMRALQGRPEVVGERLKRRFLTQAV